MFPVQRVQAPGEVSSTLAESEQDKQFEAVPPEQVAQSPWQAVQLETEDLYSFAAQLVQGPAEGWVNKTLAEFEQLKH